MTHSAEAVRTSITVLQWSLAAEAGAPRQPPPRFTEAEWDDLLSVAARHHVIGVIAGQADALDLPSPVRAGLRERRISAVTASMPVRSAAVTITTALNEAGVRCLTYKGPALAVATTGDPSARGAGDVDVLVSPEDVPVAADVLEALGARFVPGYIPDARSPLWPTARRLNCEMPYKWRGTDIDLHWRFDRLPQVVAVPFDDLWARRQRVELGAGEVETLGSVDALLVTASHGTKEHWRHWRWVVDVVRQARGVDGWAAVRSLARDGGCEMPLAVALAMHEKLAPLPTAVDRRPGATAEALAETAWWRSGEGAAPFGSVSLAKQVQRMRWNVQTAPSAAAVGSMLVRQGWTTLDMAELPLPAGLVWAYPLVRPYLWARRLRTGRFGPARLRAAQERRVA